MGVDYCRQGCVITPAPCHLSHYVASSQYVRASLLVDTTVTRTHPGVILVRKNALRLLCSTLNNALAQKGAGQCSCQARTFCTGGSALEKRDHSDADRGFALHRDPEAVQLHWVCFLDRCDHRLHATQIKYKQNGGFFMPDSRRVLVGTPGTEVLGTKHVSNPDFAAILTRAHTQQPRAEFEDVDVWVAFKTG